jgi:hypothetical protein
MMVWLLLSTPSCGVLKKSIICGVWQVPGGCKAWVWQVFFEDLSLGVQVQVQFQGQVRFCFSLLDSIGVSFLISSLPYESVAL